MYLLAIHKIYGWPYQHWIVLECLLDFHRIYGWHHQPCRISHVIPWYPYEIWLSSDAYLVYIRNISGIISSTKFVWFLVGIQRR